MADDSKHTLERIWQIWDDRDGTRLEVGPDRDGLELVELRCYEPDGKITERITLTENAAKLLHQALGEMLNG